MKRLAWCASSVLIIAALFLMWRGDPERLGSSWRTRDSSIHRPEPLIDTSGQAGSKPLIQDAGNWPIAREAEAVEAQESQQIAVAVLEGVVQDEQGTPLEGVSLRIVYEGTRGTELPDRVATDRLGTFLLQGLSHFTVEMIIVESTAKTAQVTATPRVAVAVGSVQRTKLIVHKGYTLRGQAIVQDGAPAKYATILAWNSPFPESVMKAPPPADRTAVSDESGRFVLEGVGEHICVIAQAPGLTSAGYCYGRLEPRLVDKVLKMTLWPEGSQEGIVTAESGAPLIDTKVTAQLIEIATAQSSHVSGITFYPYLVLNCTSSADGRFVFDGAVEGRYLVSAEKQGFAPQSQRVDLPNPLLDVRLDEGAQFEGTIKRWDGSAADDALVFMKINRQEWETRTDHSGAFAFAHLPAMDNVVLGVRDAASARYFAQPDGHSIDITLEPPAKIEGTLLGVDGLALPHTVVYIEGSRKCIDPELPWRLVSWEYLDRRTYTRSDGSGRFVFERLYPGAYTLRVALPGERYCSWRASAGKTDLVLRMEERQVRGVTLRGRVTAEGTNEPVRTFKVSVCPVNDSGIPAATRVQAFADESGLYEFEAGEEGLLVVSVIAEGYASSSLDAALYRAGVTTIDFDLKSDEER